MQPTQRSTSIRSLGLAILLSSAAASAASASPQMAEDVAFAGSAAVLDRNSYSGRDGAGVPRYVERSFSNEERRLLREQFGIEEPRRLYLSDTLPGATLVYDTDRDRGEHYFVSSYRIGAPSVRRPGETWEELERRLARTSPDDFPAAARRTDASIASLHPSVRPEVARLLAAARRAGFRVRVTEARRSVERQAYLLTLNGHLTHTATSRHSDGLAIDVVVDDGNLKSRTTRAHWIAFRRWVEANESGTFRLIGTPEQSWDWPHIEYVAGPPRFGSLEELLDAARWCDGIGTADCTAAWRWRSAGDQVQVARAIAPE